LEIKTIVDEIQLFCYNITIFCTYYWYHITCTCTPLIVIFLLWSECLLLTQIIMVLVCNSSCKRYRIMESVSQLSTKMLHPGSFIKSVLYKMSYSGGITNWSREINSLYVLIKYNKYLVQVTLI
jgi:hypothetical protein